MRLLIISHTPHYLLDGVVVGWGATMREIDELSRLFESVVHIAPLHPEPPPASSMRYQSSRVRVRIVRPAGGERLRDKLAIPLRYPGYARIILQERQAADVIHVRCPANISLLALILLGILRSPRRCWIKYAGDWNRGDGEPLSYRVQRWLLSKNFHGGVVTVNGRSPNQAAHIHSFLNPCLLQAELDEGVTASLKKNVSQPVRLIFVGRIESAKGVGVCLEVLANLQKAGVVAQLDLIGEGDETMRFEQQARNLGVSSLVKFHGGLPRDVLGQFYARAHFILLPSDSEGWPKVLSEAMAYGVVPIASAVGSIAEYLDQFATGQAISSRNPRLFSESIETYLRSPLRWEDHSQKAVQAARQFGYDSYLRAVHALLHLPVLPKPVPA